jgi:hypothetical protein
MKRRGMLSPRAVLLAACVLLGAGDVGLAQRGEPRITVTSAILADPATQVAVAIRVEPTDAVPANSFVRLRGLPASVSLTEGHAIGPGSWAVPLFSLPTLKANVPTGVSGRSELIVNLVTVDGTVLAEARSALVVAAPSPAAAPEPPPKRATIVTPPVPVPAGRPDRLTPRPPEISAEEKARTEKLVVQGERFLAEGKVEAARQFFRRAADAGLAAAAIRLATTYDPVELRRLQAQGVVPDTAEARKWYERARELGAPEADEKLARLGGN